MGSNFKATAGSKKFNARAALLVGTSALAIALGARSAAADDAPSAPPADPQKWQPFVSLGGKVGPNAGGAEVIGFDPIWQDLNSLLYVRIGLGKPSDRKLLTNVGVGYRTKLDGDWIGGFYAGFDSEDGRDTGHTYTQGSLGFEAMSADWDVRLNGYMVFGDRPRDIAPGNYSLFIQDTRIAILKEQEFAYSGFDGEVGYRVFNTDNFDIRLFAGGFDFGRVSAKTTIGGKTFDLGPGRLAGPMGRAEFELFGLDAIGPQSRLTLTGEITHDDVHGTTGFAGISLRVPLNLDGTTPDSAITDDLDRRMVDDVRRRDGVAVASGYSKPESVIIYNGTITSEPTNTLYYVDNTLGAGSYADPTTLHDATARGPVNQFIVLTDHDGSTVTASGVTVQSGETLVGPGIFKVKGATSGATFTHDFASGSGPVTVTSSDTNALTLQSDTNLFGFTIDGTSTNAIYGHNVTDVVIGDLTVNGGGTITNGIDIVQNNGTSGTVTIDGVVITGVTGDGIHVDISNSTGSTATQAIDISNADIVAGNDGISVVSSSSGGSNETVDLGIHNSNLTGGNVDLYQLSTANAGSTLTTTTVVDPTYLVGGYYGFLSYGYAFGTGTLTQNITLDQVYVSGTIYNGIGIGAFAYGGGHVTQHISLTDVTVDGGLYPVVIGAYAEGTGSNITQTIYGNHIGIKDGYYSNLSILAYAGYGGTVHQSADLYNVSATGSYYGYGVNLQARAFESGHVVQDAYFENLTATNNYYGGVNLEARADNFTPGNSAVAAQYVGIFDSNISNNGGDGVFAGVNAYDDSAARQDLTVGFSILDGNYYHGVHANAGAGYFGAAEQHVTLFFDDISFNGLGGVFTSADAYAVGSVNQTLGMYYVDVIGNDGDGIGIHASASGGGQVTQGAQIYGVFSEGNFGDGLNITTDSYGYFIGSYSTYYSHISQNVVAAYDTFSFNGANGVEIRNNAGYGAQTNQTVYVYDTRLNDNGGIGGLGNGNGLYEYSLSNAYGTFGNTLTTNIYSDVYVVGSSAFGNDVDGLRFKGDMNGPGYLIQTIDVINTRSGFNGRSGLVAYANAENFYSLNIQYLNVINSAFYANNLDGMAFLSTQAYGPLSFGASIQDVRIQNTFTGFNGRDGLYAFTDASAFQGRAEQHFTILGSYFDDNYRNGATFYNRAHDGVLYSTYTCDTVQGLTGGCAFDRQTITAAYSVFDFNGGHGISITNYADNYGAIYGSGGRPNAPTLYTYFVESAGNGGDGLHIYNHAANGSYIFNYDVLVASHFDNNANDGIFIESNAVSGSTIVQKGILYGIPGYETSASGNGNNGVHVVSDATGGTVRQLIEAYYANVNNNRYSGIYMEGHASIAPANSVIGQYLEVAYSNVSNNRYGFGVAMIGTAEGSNAVVQQNGYFVDSSIDHSGRTGIYAHVNANDFAAADQYLYFNAVNVSNNNGDGIYVGGIASNVGSGNQKVVFTYSPMGTSYVDANSGNGIALNAHANNGGQFTQNASVYEVYAADNGGNGFDIGAHAEGYAFGFVIYYSHVTQNVLAAFDTFSYNDTNGIRITDTAYYGGAMNQFLYFGFVDASHNAKSGLDQYSELTAMRGYNFALSTNINSSLYLIGSSFDYNGGDGIHQASYNNGPTYHPGSFGGYSYLIQHNGFSGIVANYNEGDGLNVYTRASGRYGFNGQYFTISNSDFNYNYGNGATFKSSDFYGPGSFGVAFQQATISGSDFAHNYNDGLALAAIANGRQGRAEQHFTIANSYVYDNGSDGVNIYARATDGVYVAGIPCTSVQGLNGGCAFVRQNVTMIGGAVYDNGGDGIDVGTFADNFGAIYGVSGRPHNPTLEVYGTNVTGNGNRGLNVSNRVINDSYLFQYIAAVDSHFDHNSADGIYSSTYAGGDSVAGIFNTLYSYHAAASFSYNGNHGFKSTVEALGGSYVYNENTAFGVDLSNNGGFGFEAAISYASGTSLVKEHNSIYFNTILRNNDGIGLYSVGPGADQASYIGQNLIAHNAFVGVYGETNFGGFQYVGVYTFNNGVFLNGTDYLFNAFGGATQIVN